MGSAYSKNNNITKQSIEKHNFIHPKCNYITRFNDRILNVEYPELIFSIFKHRLYHTGHTRQYMDKLPLAHLICNVHEKTIFVRIYKYNDNIYLDECKIQTYTITYDTAETHFQILLDNFLSTYDFILETNYNFFHDKIMFTQNYFDSLSIDIAKQLLKLALTYDSKISYPLCVIMDTTHHDESSSISRYHTNTTTNNDILKSSSSCNEDSS